MSALRPLAKAITARLRGDATLTALVPGGIHNGSAPTTAPRPYLVFGSPVEEEEAVMGRFGASATVEFDTFTPPTVKSDGPANEILDRVEILLRTPLALDGHTPARGRKEFRTVQVEDDETRHGTMRLAFATFET